MFVLRICWVVKVVMGVELVMMACDDLWEVVQILLS